MGTQKNIPIKRRSIFIIGIAAVMLLNAIILVVLGNNKNNNAPIDQTYFEKEISQTDSVTASDNTEQTAEPETQNVEERKDGAFNNIIPAEGEYADIIDEFIKCERSAMENDEKIITFVGDCTLGTWPSSYPKTNYTDVYNASGSPTYSFDNVKSFFVNDDFTYINLETTLTTSEDKARSQYFNFKGSPSWAKDMIAASGVDGCNLANNHAYDWGESGYLETVKSIEEAGMQAGDEELVIETQLGNINLILISCNYIYPCGGRDKLFGDDLTDYVVSLVEKHKKQKNQ